MTPKEPKSAVGRRFPSGRVPTNADRLDLPGGFRFRHEVSVRLADTDAFGHVNNATYVTYCEVARFAYLNAVTGTGLPLPTPDAPVSFILARTELDHRSAAGVGDTVTVETRTASVGRSSVIMEYRLTAAAAPAPARLVAVGRGIIVWYDYSRGVPLPLEVGMVRELERFEHRPLRSPPSPVGGSA